MGQDGPAQGVLFTNRVRRVQPVFAAEPVRVENSSEADFVIDSLGQQWVRKEMEKTGFNAMLAESLCWLLAREIGVPIPDAAAVDAPGQEAWLSRFQTSNHWEASQANFVTNLDGVGAMLALDAIVSNPDRHAGNVLLEPVSGPTELFAWAIDYGNSLAGYIDDLAKAGTSLPRTGNLAQGLGIPPVVKGAQASAAKAAGLSATLLREFVEEACDLAREQRRADLHSALVARTGQAVQLVDAYLRVIGALK